MDALFLFFPAGTFSRFRVFLWVDNLDSPSIMTLLLETRELILSLALPISMDLSEHEHEDEC
jgi:hypothetical protein